MEVILLQDVNKVGKKGEIVKVSDGYGQNYLIKNNLAIKSTPQGRKQLEIQKQKEELQDALNKQEAEALKEQLEKMTLEFKVKTGKDGRIFGGVSTKHIVEKLNNEYGIKVDKRKFQNSSPANALGTTQYHIELYKGVVATLRVHLSEK